MSAPPLPSNEAERLALLRSYCVLDTPQEPIFQDLTTLAAKLFNVPVVLISLVDEHRQFFKAATGFSVSETSRNVSFCAYSLLNDVALIVPNACDDERFRDNPLVTGEPRIRFYAGAPLIAQGGLKLGTFCILDRVPRDNFDHDAYEALQRFASIAVELIERRLLPETLEKARQENADLQRQKQEEIAASRAKTNFLSNMSHEIRTPMNGVLGMIQLLTSTPLSPEQQHYATVARSSGRMLLSIIDDILDLSKIEAEKTILEKLNFSLRATLDDVAQTWHTQALLKGLAFTLEVAPDMPTRVCGDPTRLRQILNNLISNAIKFTARGSVTVTVDSSGDEDGRVTLCFRITDSGIGLTPTQIKELFQPFVQADSSTTRKYGGTGLGLVICKRLIELMGGAITVESREGEGSTFLFTNTVGRCVEAFTPPVEVGCEAIGTSSVQRNGAGSTIEESVAGLDQRHPGRILVAEDNPTNRLVITAQLGKLGYQLDVVNDGAEAVEAVRLRAYSLILMDCEMPTMDGYEATRRIRALPGPYVPIIALTAHAMSGQREVCLEAGMDYFLSKPLDLGILKRVLRERCVDVSPVIPTAASEQLSNAPLDHTPSESLTAIFDPDSLLKRLMEDRSLADLIIEGFLSDCPSQLAVLHQCVAAGDEPGVLRQAHALKGSSASVSAHRLSNIALTLELAASSHPDQWKSLLASAVEAFEQFKDVLTSTGWLVSAVNVL